MREEREIAGLKRFESIKKKKKIYPIQLQYHLTFTICKAGWGCSNTVKCFKVTNSCQIAFFLKKN